MPRTAYESWKPALPAARTVLKVIEICEEYAADGHSMTLRQVYYQMVARGHIPNNQRSYKNLGNLISRARLAGLLDWDHIVDRTRSLRTLSRWSSPSHAIKSIANQYHIDLHIDQPTRIEIWVEKEALAAVIQRTAERYDIPFFACKGYVSQSEMHSAAQRLRRHINAGQRTVILHLGDHDPSGIDMSRDIDDRLSDFLHTDLADEHDLWNSTPAAPAAAAATGAPAAASAAGAPAAASAGTCTRADIGRWFTRTHDRIGSPGAGGNRGIPLEVRRIALTMQQIDLYDPPPNPAKLTDSRSQEYVRNYGDESWELDALDPRTLDDLITTHVDELLDPDIFQAAQERKAIQRDTLLDLADIPYADLLTLVEQHTASNFTGDDEDDT